MRAETRRGLLVALLLAGSAFGTASPEPPRPAPAGTPPNLLLVVADDLGVDFVPAYGVGSDLPVTPNLDTLAAEGVLFRNAWANPLCSPTRATLLTGRYGFRTGVGDVAMRTGPPLPLAETTLPELLDAGGSGYAHALIGKWHLGSEGIGGTLAPNVSGGFDHFDGSLIGSFEPPGLSYFHWPRVTNGVQTLDETYNTTTLVDEALAWTSTAPEPWFCTLSFHAPHAPFHAPPAGLYTEDLSGLDPVEDPRPFYKAMIEAMDAELGRLLAGLGPSLSNTLVVFVGDNGTPNTLPVPPFVAGRAKGTLYEGGVRVPLLVRGPLVAQPGSECTALVNAVDLFTTLAEVAGVDPEAHLGGAPLDGRSLVPLLLDPSAPGPRRWIYAERFEPSGATGQNVSSATRAIRDERWKLIREGGGPWELYDLVQDPFELNDLLSNPPLSPGASQALTGLNAELRSLLVGPGPWTPAAPQPTPKPTR